MISRGPNHVRLMTVCCLAQIERDHAAENTQSAQEILTELRETYEAKRAEAEPVSASDAASCARRLSRPPRSSSACASITVCTALRYDP